MKALVSKEMARDRCAFGQGEQCCAFLIAGPDGLECAKTGPYEATLRARLLLGSMTAKGDRCSGPPEFTAAATRRELLAKAAWAVPTLTVILSASALPAYMNEWPSGGIPALARPKR